MIVPGAILAAGAACVKPPLIPPPRLLPGVRPLPTLGRLAGACANRECSADEAAAAPQPVLPQPRPPRGVVAPPRHLAAGADGHPLLPGSGAAGGSGEI